MSLVKTNKKGFTLIELVIVLAIAALILAGILLAVSGAQKSRRDAQRKNDLGRILANVETFSSNHGGLYPNTLKAPTTPAGAEAAYSGMTDPLSGTAYNYASALPTNTTGTAGDIFYILGTGGGQKSCDGSAFLTLRQFAVFMKLESNDVACLDNH